MIVALLVAAGVLLSLGLTRSLVWRVENLNTTASGLSLAVDAQGAPHVALTGGPTNGIVYARRAGGSWTQETVDTGTWDWEYLSNPHVALDASGRPHLSYQNTNQGLLKYAVWTGSAWSIGTVETNFTHGDAFALDASGNPAIAYVGTCTAPDGGWLCWVVNYTHATASGWAHETVDPTDGAGVSVRLAFDPQGRPHIAYLAPGPVNFWNSTIRYASWTGSAWTNETAVSAEDEPGALNAGTTLVLAIDASGRPGIAYFSENAVRYAYRTADGWAIETVAPSYHILDDRSLDLAFDPSGRAVVAYPAGGNLDEGALVLATRSDGAWARETVDGGIQGVAALSLAVDGSGGRHILYDALFNCGWWYSCNSVVKYASASTPEDGNALTWALAISGAATGAAAAVVFFWDRRKHA